MEYTQEEKDFLYRYVPHTSIYYMDVLNALKFNGWRQILKGHYLNLYDICENIQRNCLYQMDIEQLKRTLFVLERKGFVERDTVEGPSGTIYTIGYRKHIK